jgi:hypothetical protein
MLERHAAPDPPPGFPDPPRDWFEFWVRFVFGALFGIVVGLWVWLRVFSFSPVGWIALPATSILFGFVAARYGDRFWESLQHLWWF